MASKRARDYDDDSDDEDIDVDVDGVEGSAASKGAEAGSAGASSSNSATTLRHEYNIAHKLVRNFLVEQQRVWGREVLFGKDEVPKEVSRAVLSVAIYAETAVRSAAQPALRLRHLSARLAPFLRVHDVVGKALLKLGMLFTDVSNKSHVITEVTSRRVEQLFLDRGDCSWTTLFEFLRLRASIFLVADLDNNFDEAACSALDCGGAKEFFRLMPEVFLARKRRTQHYNITKSASVAFAIPSRVDVVLRHCRRGMGGMEDARPVSTDLARVCLLMNMFVPRAWTTTEFSCPVGRVSVFALLPLAKFLATHFTQAVREELLCDADPPYPDAEHVETGFARLVATTAFEYRRDLLERTVVKETLAACYFSVEVLAALFGLLQAESGIGLQWHPFPEERKYLELSLVHKLVTEGFKPSLVSEIVDNSESVVFAIRLLQAYVADVEASQHTLRLRVAHVVYCGFVKHLAQLAKVSVPSRNWRGAIGLGLCVGTLLYRESSEARTQFCEDLAWGAILREVASRDYPSEFLDNDDYGEFEAVTMLKEVFALAELVWQARNADVGYRFVIGQPEAKTLYWLADKHWGEEAKRVLTRLVVEPLTADVSGFQPLTFCVVCQEEPDAGTTVTGPVMSCCGKVPCHKDCLAQWAMTSCKCPSCGVSFLSEEV